MSASADAPFWVHLCGVAETNALTIKQYSNPKCKKGSLKTVFRLLFAFQAALGYCKSSVDAAPPIVPVVFRLLDLSQPSWASLFLSRYMA